MAGREDRYDSRQSAGHAPFLGSVKEPGYIAAGEATAGINNLVLLYNGWYSNGFGNWKKESFLPFLGYVGTDGKPKDWMFDGVLMLGLKAPSGRDFTGASNKTDWEWYLNKTFDANGANRFFVLSGASGDAFRSKYANYLNGRVEYGYMTDAFCG